MSQTYERGLPRLTAIAAGIPSIGRYCLVASFPLPGTVFGRWTDLLNGSAIPSLWINQVWGRMCAAQGGVQCSPSVLGRRLNNHSVRKQAWEHFHLLREVSPFCHTQVKQGQHK